MSRGWEAETTGRISHTHDQTQRWHSPLGSVGTGLASGYWPKSGRGVTLWGPHTQHSLLVLGFLEVTQSHLTGQGPRSPQIHGKGPFVRLGDHRLGFEGLGVGSPWTGARAQSQLQGSALQERNRQHPELHPELARSVVVQIPGKHLFGEGGFGWEYLVGQRSRRLPVGQHELTALM